MCYNELIEQVEELKQENKKEVEILKIKTEEMVTEKETV